MPLSLITLPLDSFAWANNFKGPVRPPKSALRIQIGPRSNCSSKKYLISLFCSSFLSISHDQISSSSKPSSLILLHLLTERLFSSDAVLPVGKTSDGAKHRKQPCQQQL